MRAQLFSNAGTGESCTGRLVWSTEAGERSFKLGLVELGADASAPDEAWPLIVNLVFLRLGAESSFVFRFLDLRSTTGTLQP